MSDGLLPEEQRFDSELRRLVRWRLFFFGTWAGTIPALMLIGNPLGLVFDSSVPSVCVAFGGMASFVYCAIRISLFRCPRCRKRYTFKRFPGWIAYNNPFTSKCLHCGLSRRKQEM